MIVRLHTRVTMAIIGLIAVLVVVFSGLLFVQFRETMNETRRSNSEAMASALLKQAERQAVGLAGFLAESLALPLAHERWDILRDLAASARRQRGVDSVSIFDATRGIVIDGVNTMPRLVWAPDAEAETVLTGRSSVMSVSGRLLHVAVPVLSGDRVLGGVRIGLSLDDIQADIAVAQDLIADIDDRGMADLVTVGAIATFFFAALGILFGVAVARGISGPIEKLVALTRQIGRGSFDVTLPERRSDEIGELGDALVTMARQRRDAEERAHQLQVELAHVGRVSAMGEMATGLAHELNQPLTAIANYMRGGIARLRRTRTASDDVLEAMDRAAAEALRAGEVIRRVRAFVQKVEPEMVPVDLNAVIRETLDLLHGDAERQGVVVTLNLADGLPRILADKIQIQQVILNLARNGIEAACDNARRAPRLVISTLPPTDDGVQVIVRDSGQGVADEIRESLFHPFVTTKGDGLGMGLAICRSIVEAHNGGLQLEPETGAGTAFRLTLPVAPPPEVEKAGADGDAGSPEGRPTPTTAC